MEGKLVHLNLQRKHLQSIHFNLSPDFANVQNNYDIEKSVCNSDKVFYGMECTAPEVRAKVQSSTIHSQPFALKLIDRDDGSELLEINRNGLNDVPTVTSL